VPSLVRFTYHPPAANFAAEDWQLQARLKLLDTWIESTNRRCAEPPRGEQRSQVPASPPEQGEPPKM
jgi:hypothetical protein